MTSKRATTEETEADLEARIRATTLDKTVPSLRHQGMPMSFGVVDIATGDDFRLFTIRREERRFFVALRTQKGQMDMCRRHYGLCGLGC